jgi:lysozyme family protein
MDRNFSRSLNAMLAHEGGFVNHPKDPGGATNLGVTLANFRRYVKPDGTVDDLKKLTREQAGVVYRRQYWDEVMGSSLPDGVDHAVFDFAVNSGPGRAAKYLQAIAGVKQDGKVGPATLKAVAALDADSVINELCDRRQKFLQGLSTFATFGKGWTRRVKEVRALALELAGQAPEAARVVVKEVEVEKPVAVDVKAPGMGAADAATGAGIGAAGLGGTIQTLQEQLTPFSAAGGWISKLVVALIIIGGLMTVGGLAWRWWARRKKKATIAAINAPEVQ